MGDLRFKPGEHYFATWTVGFIIGIVFAVAVLGWVRPDPKPEGSYAQTINAAMAGRLNAKKIEIDALLTANDSLRNLYEDCLENHSGH